jgi:hypothetical protein
MGEDTERDTDKFAVDGSGGENAEAVSGEATEAISAVFRFAAAAAGTASIFGRDFFPGRLTGSVGTGCRSGSPSAAPAIRAGCGRRPTSIRSIDIFRGVAGS